MYLMLMCCISRSKTPGGRLVYLYPGKRGTVAKCGDCKCKLRGVRPS